MIPFDNSVSVFGVGDNHITARSLLDLSGTLQHRGCGVGGEWCNLLPASSAHHRRLPVPAQSSHARPRRKQPSSGRLEVADTVLVLGVGPILITDQLPVCEFVISDVGCDLKTSTVFSQCGLLGVWVLHLGQLSRAIE